MASEATRPFSFVQITDRHVGRSTVNSAAILIEDPRQIEAEAGDRVAFIAATGDLTDHGTEKECRMYVEAIAACRLKVHPVVGNHDYVNGTWQEPKMDAGWYQKLIAPQTFNYTVTIFDPATDGPDTVRPVISGPDNPLVGQPNPYTFNAVPNHTGHQWRYGTRAVFTAIEGAETGLSNCTTNVSPGYAIIVHDVVASGSAAFHLAHPDATTQTLTYQRVLLPGATAQLQFHSRLGWATSDQVAQVQVSTDEGVTWNDVYHQPGSDGSGEESFNLRTIPLASYAGRTILVRFRYHFTTGSYYPQTSTGVGWYLDDIAFTDTEELTAPVTTDLPTGTAFDFNPAATGDFALQVRAKVYDAYRLEWGPAKRVTAVVQPPPEITITAITLTGNTATIDFTVANHHAGLTFHLLRAATVAGSYAPDPAASLSTLVPNSSLRFTTATGGASHLYFRVQSP
jgi:hypothetical protein